MNIEINSKLFFPTERNSDFKHQHFVKTSNEWYIKGGVAF